MRGDDAEQNADPMQPPDFLAIRVHHEDAPVGLTGLCAGYEGGAWRVAQLASHLLEWLPDFALTFSEREVSAPIMP